MAGWAKKPEDYRGMVRFPLPAFTVSADVAISFSEKPLPTVPVGGIAQVAPEGIRIGATIAPAYARRPHIYLMQPGTAPGADPIRTGDTGQLYTALLFALDPTSTTIPSAFDPSVKVRTAHLEWLVSNIPACRDTSRGALWNTDAGSEVLPYSPFASEVSSSVPHILLLCKQHESDPPEVVATKLKAFLDSHFGTRGTPGKPSVRAGAASGLKPSTAPSAHSFDVKALVETVKLDISGFFLFFTLEDSGDR